LVAIAQQRRGRDETTSTTEEEAATGRAVGDLCWLLVGDRPLSAERLPQPAICSSIGGAAVGARWPGLASTFSQTTTGPGPDRASAATPRHSSTVWQE
jgi:hypothetical protein